MKRGSVFCLLVLLRASCLLVPTHVQAVDLSTESLDTAIGPIPLDPTGFLTYLLQILFGISGGIALLLMIFGSFQVILSSGNPDKVKAGQEIITSAIMGLLFIIFSIFILRFIGVEILQIPGIFK